MADFQHSTRTPSAKPGNHTFNAAQWLSHFESMGGAYVATDTRTCFCTAHDAATADEQRAARTMLRKLTGDQRAEVIAYIRGRAGFSATQPDMKSVCSQAVRDPAAISPASSGDALGNQSKGTTDMDMSQTFEAATPFNASAVWAPGTGGEFGIAAEAWKKAVRAIEEHRGDEDIPDELCNVEAVAWQTMLNTPAPDLAALRLKLERLLHVEPAVDATNAWDGAEVQQTLADIAQLMDGPAGFTTIQADHPTFDHGIAAEWQRWKATFARYNALPFDDSEEEKYEEIIDEAEEAIRSSVAKTVAGATIQVKVALHHMLTRRDDEAALMAGDLDHLENAGLDWAVRLVLAALRSLEHQGAPATFAGLRQPIRAAPANSGVTNPRAEWEAAMIRHQAALAAYAPYANTVRIPEGIRKEVGASYRNLMNTPSPDTDALRWKLKEILGDAEEDCALADAFRLLGMRDGPTPS